MNILVTGSNGQLGSEIFGMSNLFPDMQYFFTDVEDLDITVFEQVENFIKRNKIGAVINCAAYTRVDQAEIENEIANKVNEIAVVNLLDALKSNPNARLIHISTDYVFDGCSHVPYEEKFQTNPINFYGASKRMGEKHIESSSIDAIVIRTSWLYSIHGNNFVKTMLRLGQNKDSISVIYDQVGTPTNAGDLAAACLEIINSPNRMDTMGKVFHYSNEGVASWYDFAFEIMKLAGLNCEVNPILTRNYPETPAKRPHYSVMSKEKIKETFNLSIPHWRQSLKECLNQLKN